MRALSLLPVLAAAVAILPASAVPISMSTIIAGQSVALVGPSSVPNPGGVSGGVPGSSGLSGLDKVPVPPSLRHRAVPVSPIEARQVHNADFSASPNKTIPGTSDSAPASSAQKRSEDRKHRHHSDKKHAQGKAAKTPSTDLLSEAAVGGTTAGSASKDPSHAEDAAHVPGQRRAESHKHSSKHSSKYENKHESQQHSASDAPSGPADLTSGLASGVKAVGGAPKQLSQVTDEVPGIPDTPLTTADVPSSNAGTGQVPVPQPDTEKEVPAGSSSYPSAVSYSYSAPTPSTDASGAKRRRGDMVLSTNPLMPEKGRDPNEGMFNWNSNHKAEDDKDAAPKKGNVAPGGTDTATAPTATATPTSTDSFAEPTSSYKGVA